MTLGAAGTVAPPAAAHGRTAVLGRRHMISSTHYSASFARARMFERGGNAVDAGVAAGLALNVVQPSLCSLGGVAPIMLFAPGMSAPVTIDGLGRAPAAASLEAYLARYGGDMPEGIPRTVVPAALDAWLAALQLYGRLTFAEVAAPATALADGFPVHARLARDIEQAQGALRAWPTTAAVFLAGGRVPRPGDVLVQRDLADLLRRLAAVERASEARGRAGAIQAVRDAFYRGDIARRIAAFIEGAGGMLAYDDLAAYAVRQEAPVRTTYRGYDVYACGPWSQGPVVPMTLNILEAFDIGGMDPGEPERLHLLAEALKLAFADREAYVGDPEHVDVPIAGLLDTEYAASRRARLDTGRASPELPAPGDPWRYEGRTGRIPPAPVPVGGARHPDTQYVCAVDDEGHAFSATPSDPALSGPLVPDLGIVASTRGSQFWLDARHPAVIAPRKRPRLTPNPAMVLRRGRVVMPIGCPGGDAQPQGMVQVLSNVVDFGMDVQEAIERPRICSLSFPDSFWPHAYEPGMLAVEGRIDTSVRAGLEARGHAVRVWPAWTSWAAAVCAITVDAGGTFAGGADPRHDSAAVGW